MVLRYSARSHSGKVRGNNEDNLYVNGVSLTREMRERPFLLDGHSALPAIFAVCDGMGGEAHGERASLLAVETLSDMAGRIQASAPECLDRVVQQYVREAYAAIHWQPGAQNLRTGTTLALLVAAEKGLRCFNLGDSRIYGLQRFVFRQITTDHTAATEQTLYGGLSRTQSNGGYKLTRCIGMGQQLAAESYMPIKGNCRILICSDGLTDMVSSSEIEKIVRTFKKTPAAADALIHSALAKGGKDNITVIVVDARDKEGLLRCFLNRRAR